MSATYGRKLIWGAQEIKPWKTTPPGQIRICVRNDACAVVYLRDANGIRQHAIYDNGETWELGFQIGANVRPPQGVNTKDRSCADSLKGGISAKLVIQKPSMIISWKSWVFHYWHKTGSRRDGASVIHAGVRILGVRLDIWKVCPATRQSPINPLLQRSPKD